MSAPSLSSLEESWRFKRVARQVANRYSERPLHRAPAGHGRPVRIETVKVGSGDLLEIKFDHHVFGDLPAFGSPVLQAIKATLHVGNPALQSRGEGFVGQRRADDGRDNLMQVGEALNRYRRGVCSSICGSSALMRSRRVR